MKKAIDVHRTSKQYPTENGKNKRFFQYWTKYYFSRLMSLLILSLSLSLVAILLAKVRSYCWLMVCSIECGRYICTMHIPIVCGSWTSSSSSSSSLVPACFLSLFQCIRHPLHTLCSHNSLSVAIKYSQILYKISPDSSEQTYERRSVRQDPPCMYRERKMWKSELTRKCECCSISRARHTRTHKKRISAAIATAKAAAAHHRIWEALVKC